MTFVTSVQGVVATAYLVAAWLIRRNGAVTVRSGILVAVAGAVLHAAILAWRWALTGQLPIVTRYEDLTVDALTIVIVFLAVQWRAPAARTAGSLALAVAALIVAWALAHDQAGFPLDPSLRTNWLAIHAQLNSFAVGVGTLAAAVQVGWLRGGDSDFTLRALAADLTAWSFFAWGAMLAAGSYWASLAWGRYWGWDPIESWTLATLLAYAFVLHLRRRPGWQGRRWAAAAMLPFAMMMFTTYALLLLTRSVHGQYLFQ